MKKNESSHITAEVALARVLGSLVAEASSDTPPVLYLATILARAGELALVEVILGDAYAERLVLGHLLKKLEGRHLLDAKGRLFEFFRVKTDLLMACRIRFPDDGPGAGVSRGVDSGKEATSHE